jgi:radical SAM superfamily enzyme YgiQ (UPF0313 family)
MKITFLRPNMSAARAADAMQPLAFAVLAAHTPPHVELALYDERIEPVDMEHSTDLVAMTVETYTARRAYHLADHFRQRGIPVVMGGYHPTFLPDEALEHADAVVIGDAEHVWGQVVQDAAQGTLRRVYQQEQQPALEYAAFDRRLFADKRYAALVPVQYGRGCRFACDFCSIHAFYGHTLRQRPIRDVVAEIEALDSRYVLLVDDNIFADPQRAADLFTALIPLNIRWACQVSIDVARDARLLDLMAKSGCISALIGFESLNTDNLRQMKKQWNLRHTDYATAIEQFHARGIMLYATFVFGYDQDTPEAFDVTVDFALRSRFFLANFNPLTPTPGTPLYDRLHAEGRLLYDRWWLDPQFSYGQATFQPRGMTADDLTAGCFRARQQFNRYGAIFQRALNRQANCRTLAQLGIFLAANWVSRREIYRKQGVQLG